MNFLSDLIMKLLRWFYELSQKDSLQEDAQKDDKLKKHLLDRIDAHERELRVESDLRAQRTAGEAGGERKDESLGS
jgi:hypothetical protein